MGTVSFMEKLTSLISKYRIPILVLLFGIVLMLLPDLKGDRQSTVDLVQHQEIVSVENGLEDILTKIDGAGSVCVYISYSSGEETIYQSDLEALSSDTSDTERITTVTVTNEDRSETGLVRQVNPPTVQGVIVACQGADRASVRLAIVDAVSKATGLGSDCIAVLKMK